MLRPVPKNVVNLEGCSPATSLTPTSQKVNHFVLQAVVGPEVRLAHLREDPILVLLVVVPLVGVVPGGVGGSLLALAGRGAGLAMREQVPLLLVRDGEVGGGLLLLAGLAGLTNRCHAGECRTQRAGAHGPGSLGYTPWSGLCEVLDAEVGVALVGRQLVVLE